MILTSLLRWFYSASPAKVPTDEASAGSKTVEIDDVTPSDSQRINPEKSNPHYRCPVRDSAQAPIGLVKPNVTCPKGMRNQAYPNGRQHAPMKNAAAAIAASNGDATVCVHGGECGPKKGYFQPPPPTQTKTQYDVKAASGILDNRFFKKACPSTGCGGPSRRIVTDIVRRLPETLEAEIPDLSGLVSLDRRPIFTGTYSKVYVGRYGDQKVAVKVLRIVKSDRTTERKFRRELFIWWHLRHPNVLPLYGHFEHDDGVEPPHALVSEWAEGGSAAHYIHRDLSWDQRTSLLYDVAKGLQYLHGLCPCVVHGDLKPLNVLIRENGVGQLCDFGLASLLREGPESGLTTTTAHTGTVRYLARELVEYSQKAIPTTATDMYAFGCVALEFIHRTPPHSALDNPWKISRAISDGIPPARRPLNSREVLPVLWNMMEACWSTDPNERPTAEGIYQHLRHNPFNHSPGLWT